MKNRMKTLIGVGLLIVMTGLLPQACGSETHGEDGGHETGRVLDILKQETLSPQVMFWALLIAFFLGAVHALEPGHGKTVVAAYLVGNRGKIRHAFALGGIVTVTHTLGIFILGAVILFVYSNLTPDQVVPWTGFLSGLIIVGVGIYLLLRSRKGRHHHHHHDHSHDHEHHHDHGHHHHHMPEEITWGSVLALGISGGLVPCPGALVILLTAVSLNRTAFGLLLLLAFSFGLAAILIAIGVLMVMARPLMDRWSGEGRFIRMLPRISAVVIIVLGLVMALHSLTAGGIVHLHDH